MSEQDLDQRKAYTDALRKLADMLDKHPNLPLPYCQVGTWVSAEYDGEGYDDENIVTPAEVIARNLRRGVSGWRKTGHDRQTDYVTYSQVLTPEDVYPVVSYALHAGKAGTCKRVQIGTRHREAVEAHDEPVYAWECE